MTFKLPLSLTAGIIEHSPDSDYYKPLPTQGLLTISKAESQDDEDDDMGMLSFVWKPLDPSADKKVETIEKVLFPGEQIIIPHTSLKESAQFPSSLIYLLTFRSGEVVPFYIQDPSSTNLSTYIKKDAFKGHSTASGLNKLNDELMGVFTDILKGDYE